jgi:acetyltransferase-like isoleucine patch superfamily enzyme
MSNEELKSSEPILMNEGSYTPEQSTSGLVRLRRALLSLVDFRSYFHVLRLIHFYGYSHVRQKSCMKMGSGSRMAPNTSLRYGNLITVGKNCHIGERCYLWAGPSKGRIMIDDFTSLAPEVFITTSDYQFRAGTPFRQQPQTEKDVIIGSDVWLGARVIITAGVTIGNGCIVGAGSVVTRDLPANSIAVGVPARVVDTRLF